MRYANAGHPRPLLLHRDTATVEQLVVAKGKSNPALGLYENAVYETAESFLSPHDLVMFFTDGLYEVEGANQQIYTLEMLAEAIKKRATLPASVLFDQLLEEIKGFAADHEFPDDVCVVGLEVTHLKELTSGA
jgi:sigma-B regulation protein RsbU (phosphoserine phosphatase)